MPLPEPSFSGCGDRLGTDVIAGGGGTNCASAIQAEKRRRPLDLPPLGAAGTTRERPISNRDGSKRKPNSAVTVTCHSFRRKVGRSWQTNWQTRFQIFKNPNKSGVFHFRVKEVLFH